MKIINIIYHTSNLYAYNTAERCSSQSSLHVSITFFRIVCSSKPLVCGRYAVRVTKSIVEMLDLLDYQQEAKHELRKDLQSSLKLRAEAVYDSLPKDMQRSVSIACETFLSSIYMRLWKVVYN